MSRLALVVKGTAFLFSLYAIEGIMSRSIVLFGLACALKFYSQAGVNRFVLHDSHLLSISIFTLLLVGAIQLDLDLWFLF